ncbi:hypothetical protein D3C85_1848400 [compost metagenome]
MNWANCSDVPETSRDRMSARLLEASALFRTLRRSRFNRATSAVGVLAGAKMPYQFSMTKFG